MSNTVAPKESQIARFEKWVHFPPSRMPNTPTADHSVSGCAAHQTVARRMEGEKVGQMGGLQMYNATAGKPKMVPGSKEKPNETDRISIGWSCNAGRGCRLHGAHS